MIEFNDGQEIRPIGENEKQQIAIGAIHEQLKNLNPSAAEQIAAILTQEMKKIESVDTAPAADGGQQNAEPQLELSNARWEQINEQVRDTFDRMVEELGFDEGTVRNALGSIKIGANNGNLDVAKRGLENLDWYSQPDVDSPFISKGREWQDKAKSFADELRQQIDQLAAMQAEGEKLGQQVSN